MRCMGDVEGNDYLEWSRYDLLSDDCSCNVVHDTC